MLYTLPERGIELLGLKKRWDGGGTGDDDCFPETANGDFRWEYNLNAGVYVLILREGCTGIIRLTKVFMGSKDNDIHPFELNVSLIVVDVVDGGSAVCPLGEFEGSGAGMGGAEARSVCGDCLDPPYASSGDVLGKEEFVMDEWIAAEIALEE
ncbi:hypothetical protein NMY22_g19097 [Coprinellus aureogranulatus]|nr:hypothetical protein NMY22_g19097 [Coprinellus aureogranulatus]